MFAPTSFVRRRAPSRASYTYMVVILATLAAALLLLAPTDAAAQERRRGAEAAGGQPPIIPLTHFFDNPEITGAQISPDGRWLWLVALAFLIAEEVIRRRKPERSAHPAHEVRNERVA